MRRELPGAAKYAGRRIVYPQPCSVNGCDGPAHASYRTATGHQFCMSHRQRYLLLLLAQRLCDDGWLTNQEDVKQSEMRIWIDLAISGDDEAVKQRLEAHKDDLVKWQIDDHML